MKKWQFRWKNVFHGIFGQKCWFFFTRKSLGVDDKQNNDFGKIQQKNNFWQKNGIPWKNGSSGHPKKAKKWHFVKKKWQVTFSFYLGYMTLKKKWLSKVQHFCQKGHFKMHFKKSIFDIGHDQTPGFCKVAWKTFFGQSFVNFEEKSVQMKRKAKTCHFKNDFRR